MSDFVPSLAPFDEARLNALGADEHSFQEFKGSAWLCEGGVIASWFHASLSKQVSAFANSAGGRLFIGLDDLGRVDGGVPVDLKPGGTRAWLEDVVKGSVTPVLSTYNVFEVRESGAGSRILPGRAVYIIEIPGSSDAPHQSLDHRYYLRIAGKSQPMSHVHVQDVLRRTASPRVELVRLGPYGEAERDSSDPRGPRAFVCIRAFLRNQGRTLARHVGGELIVPRIVLGREARRRNVEKEGSRLTQAPGQATLFHYHPVPLFPGQEIYFHTFWIGLHSANREAVREGATIRWRVFADDAAPSEGSRPLVQFGVVQKALAWLDQVARAQRSG